MSALAVFTGGMKATMKCFIAGTLIAVESGFARIESIKPGDVVLSTNVDTMETGYKKVLEKYVRKTRELVHIIVGGKEIVSTPDHPYYVEGRGFVNACQLCIGSPLLDADGKVLEVEQIYKEQLGKNEEVTVYNFQVEDWHTYHVGEMEVLVHNAEYESGSESSIMDYSNRFADSLTDDFNHGVEVRDVVKEDMILVQFSSDAPNASLRYWTTIDEANGISTIEEYMDKMALSKEWGNRNVVKVARVKKGTEVTHAIGTAKAQTKISDPRPGNGKQILFSKFDSNWITEVRNIKE